MAYAAYQGALLVRWRRDCYRDTLDQLQRRAIGYMEHSAQVAWREAVHTLDTQMAHQIISDKTLNKKKPLDYAMEGALNYAERTN